MLTPEQATTALEALLGGGGFTSLGVAFLAYLQAAREGRPKAEVPVFSLAGTTATGGGFDEVSTSHLATIAYALVKYVAIEELRAEQDLKDGSYHDRLEAKIMRFMIEATRDSGALKKGRDRD